MDTQMILRCYQMSIVIPISIGKHPKFLYLNSIFLFTPGNLPVCHGKCQIGSIEWDTDNRNCSVCNMYIIYLMFVIIFALTRSSRAKNAIHLAPTPTCKIKWHYKFIWLFDAFNKKKCIISYQSVFFLMCTSLD